MDLITLLEKDMDEIITEAADSLAGARLRHYEASPPEQNRERLRRLAELLAESVRTRNLIPIVEYAHGLADQRFQAGFGLDEVQKAFNTLEEAVWRRITAKLRPEEYPAAFGLLSTVLGAGKEALAVRYVSLAAHRHVPSLDLSELFKGV